MNIPKKLKAYGHIYDIVFHDRECVGGTSSLGTTNVYKKLKIWIDNTMGKSQQESTLLHEIIEIISSLNSMSLNESQVCQLETGLYQILRDNNLLK